MEVTERQMRKKITGTQETVVRREGEKKKG